MTARKAVTIYYYFENLSGNTSGKSLGGKYYTENTAYRQTVNTSNDTDGWSAKTFDGFTILSGVYSSVDLVNNTATFYYTRNSYNLRLLQQWKLGELYFISVRRTHFCRCRSHKWLCGQFVCRMVQQSKRIRGILYVWFNAGL